MHGFDVALIADAQLDLVSTRSSLRAQDEGVALVEDVQLDVVSTRTQRRLHSQLSGESYGFLRSLL